MREYHYPCTAIKHALPSTSSQVYLTSAEIDRHNLSFNNLMWTGQGGPTRAIVNYCFSAAQLVASAEGGVSVSETAKLLFVWYLDAEAITIISHDPMKTVFSTTAVLKRSYIKTTGTPISWLLLFTQGNGAYCKSGCG